MAAVYMGIVKQTKNHTKPNPNKPTNKKTLVLCGFVCLRFLVFVFFVCGAFLVVVGFDGVCFFFVVKIG